MTTHKTTGEQDKADWEEGFLLERRAVNEVKGGNDDRSQYTKMKLSVH